MVTSESFTERSIKGSSMWVVKIGGSLLGSPELERC